MLGQGKHLGLRESGVFRRISFELGKDLDRTRGLWEPGRKLSRGRVWNEHGELGAKRTTLARDREMGLESDSVLKSE